ncbi:hypothetical protein RclHR1_07480008 [Rhizophagus clarus]|uniref:BTB/POZ domain-containing protein n=1 Tax=Rhizophagus clarus TaxID=94130 RepID=A0A2Z6RWJ5_9GLOM|nr:hypothetical protein RclHR1_07480008 [Rhizophagus clarus]GES79164.1 BTB/POZ domain-containing protein [Rhizophagus clarus]
MSFEHSQGLINDYEKLLEADKDYDVIIYANEKDGKFILNKYNISPQILKIILRFIYCGKINLTKLQVSVILNLLITVDELDVQILIQCIQENLINCKYDFLQQNSIEIFEMIYHYEVFSDLWNNCLDKFCEKSNELFQSDKFINLKEPLLELLLKRDDLSSDEILYGIA